MVMHFLFVCSDCGVVCATCLCGSGRGSMGFAGFHAAANFSLAISTNDLSFCWDGNTNRKEDHWAGAGDGGGYTYYCALDELFCKAWNAIFEELLRPNRSAMDAAMLNCSRYLLIRPLA